jgi:type II secretory pathway pseudopilin PulG
MHPAARSRKDQAGITLAIMLVMLVVIAMTSVAVIRGSMSADRVSNNLRLQTNATQMAQIALRYCETQALSATPALGFTLQASAVGAARWNTFASWHGTSAVSMNIPDTFLAASAVAASPAKYPQCMAEKATTADGREIIVVTARGFSPDYSEGSDGRAESGSAIWLQSVLYVSAGP